MNMISEWGEYKDITFFGPRKAQHILQCDSVAMVQQEGNLEMLGFANSN